ncbi:MAG: spermidine synthase, partial [Pirellulales bacterium]
PRSHVVVEDGRTYLAASPDRYDVIVGDLFRPWVIGTGRLYSVEHFRSVKRALRPGGLFCQWVPMYQLDRAEFEAVLTTFLQVFPRADLVRGSFRSTRPAMGLIGLRDGQIDWKWIDDRCRSFRQSQRIRDPSLRRGEGVSMYYFGHVTADAAMLPIVNTLNNPWIEIDAARRRVSPEEARDYIVGMPWIRFVTELRRRAILDPDAPPELARWSALGQKICMLHLAQKRGSELAAKLATEINQALPDDFYQDQEAAWEAWPVPRP